MSGMGSVFTFFYICTLSLLVNQFNLISDVRKSKMIVRTIFMDAWRKRKLFLRENGRWQKNILANVLKKEFKN